MHDLSYLKFIYMVHNIILILLLLMIHKVQFD